MSVYIPGMVMPTSCFDCPFLDYEQGFCLASAVKNESGCCEPVLCPGGIKGERHDECPLVPVPPHGRLIDADALLKKAHYRMGIKPGGIDEIEAFIRVTDLMEAPTIIPAEPPEEGQ